VFIIFETSGLRSGLTAYLRCFKTEIDMELFSDAYCKSVLIDRRWWHRFLHL